MSEVSVEVDRDACVGSENCVFYAPATFATDDEGKAVVVDPHGDPDEAIQLAIRSCPMRALSDRKSGAPAGGEPRDN
jgi:ferredoxin